MPLGLALRAPVAGDMLRRRADELAASGASARARARDAVLESEELDRLICAVLEHERTDQLVARVLESPGLERLIVRVLESRLVDELTERVLRSPELERVVEYVATSPQVLDAVSHQTRSLADEMAVNVRTPRRERRRRRRAHGARLAAEAPTASGMSATRVRYAGIATRALAIAIDVAIVQVLVFTGAAIIGLVASLVGDLQLDTVGRVLAACAWGLAVATYFVMFWSTVGQTPAMRMMDIRVVGPDGAPPGFGRSIVRWIGLILAIIPFFAGFLPVLVDDRRRGLQDMLARTVVVHADSSGGPFLSAPAP